MQLLAGILVHGIRLDGSGKFLWILPLCLAVAVVYKTTRYEELRKLPAAILVLWVTIVFGMYAVGVGLWALFSIMA